MAEAIVQAAKDEGTRAETLRLRITRGRRPAKVPEGAHARRFSARDQSGGRVKDVVLVEVRGTHRGAIVYLCPLDCHGKSMAEDVCRKRTIRMSDVEHQLFCVVTSPT